MFETPDVGPRDEDPARPPADEAVEPAPADAARDGVVVPEGEAGEASQGGDTNEAGGPGSLEELRRKAAERDEYLDLLKRTKADFANYRKRVDEERARWGQVAQRELLAKLLGAADQCRLAADRSKDDESTESLRSCIDLIWSEIERFLESSGVVPVPTDGMGFDPEKHEAVLVQERDDLPDGAIVDEVRAGYRFGEHVIRPAQVVVAKKPKPPEPEGTQPEIDTDEHE